MEYKCNGKKNNGKIQKSIRSTKASSPTGDSAATSSPPIGDSFLYKETRSGKHGNGVYVSFERTDFFRNSNITFYYNRFLIITNSSRKSMGRFRIQLLLTDNTRPSRYNTTKNDRYSDTSTQWTKLSLNFTVNN